MDFLFGRSTPQKENAAGNKNASDVEALRKNNKALEAQAQAERDSKASLVEENERLKREIDTVRRSSIPHTKHHTLPSSLPSSSKLPMPDTSSSLPKARGIPIPVSSLRRIPTCKAVPSSSGRASPDTPSSSVQPASLLDRLNAAEAEASDLKAKSLELTVTTRSKDAEIARLNDALAQKHRAYVQADALLQQMAAENDKSACGMCTEQTTEVIRLKAEVGRVERELREAKRVLEVASAKSGCRDAMDVDERNVLVSMELRLREAQEQLKQANDKMAASDMEDQMRTDEIEQMREQLDVYRARIGFLETEKSAESLKDQQRALELQQRAAELERQLAESKVRFDERAGSLAFEFSALRGETETAEAALKEKLAATEMQLKQASAAKEQIERTAKSNLMQAEQYVNQQQTLIN
ncbi:hypothetical protein HDU98_005148, partial [Podochytrium sp. JEL0797]